MHIFISSLVLTTALVINNSHCTPLNVETLEKFLSNKNPSSENLVKTVKDLESALISVISKLDAKNIEEFQQFLSNKNPSSENLVKTVKDLGSALISVLSTLESATTNIQSEVEVLRRDAKEARCSLSTRIIDIENNISELKKETGTENENRTTLSFYEGEGNVSSVLTGTEDGIAYRTTLSFARRGNVRKIFMDTDFFLTPKLSYLQAKMNCFREGGTPFVPKTLDEFHYIVEQVTKEEEYGWLPLNDIKDEGVVEWDDGTSYRNGPIHFPINKEYFTSNRGPWDCVLVKRDIVGYWNPCTTVAKMLCLKVE